MSRCLLRSLIAFPVALRPSSSALATFIATSMMSCSISATAQALREGAVIGAVTATSSNILIDAQGVIVAMAYFGNETSYHVRLDSGTVVKVSRTNAARHDAARLEREQRVWVWWDGADIVVLTS